MHCIDLLHVLHHANDGSSQLTLSDNILWNSSRTENAVDIILCTVRCMFVSFLSAISRAACGIFQHNFCIEPYDPEP